MWKNLGYVWHKRYAWLLGSLFLKRCIVISIVMYCYYVFEKFIDTCLKFYGLDLCHYFSSPRLTWDAMLKMSGVTLKNVNIYNLPGYE